MRKNTKMRKNSIVVLILAIVIFFGLSANSEALDDGYYKAGIYQITISGDQWTAHYFYGPPRDCAIPADGYVAENPNQTILYLNDDSQFIIVEGNHALIVDDGKWVRFRETHNRKRCD